MPYVDLLPEPLGMASIEGEHGLLRTIQNMRIDGRALKVRNGVTAEISTGPGGDECLGAAVSEDGLTAICVMKDGSSARVYKADYTSSWSAWTEVTASSGAFGSTRLSDVSSPCSIVFQRDPVTGQTYAVIQNGGTPLVVRISSGTTYSSGAGQVACPSADVAPMPDSGQVLVMNRQVVATGGHIQPKYGAMNISAGTLTLAQTGGHTISAVGTSPQLGVQLVALNNSIATSDTFQIRSAPGTSANRIDFLSGDQLWIAARYLVNTADPHEPGAEKLPWLHLKIEVSTDGTTWLEVYHPDTDQCITSPSPIAGSETTGYFYLAAFDLNGKAVSSAERAILAAVEYVRFTAVRTFRIDEIHIIGIASSGNAPALAQHGVTKFNAYTGCESPIRVLDAPVDGAAFPLAPTFWNAAEEIQPKIPLFTGLKVQYLIPTIIPTQAEFAAGVDHVRIYRRDPGEDEFQQVESSGLTAYDSTLTAPIVNDAGIRVSNYSAGTWSNVAWSIGAEERALIRDNNRTQERRGILAPDAFNLAIPAGKAMARIGSRMAVGGASGQGGLLYVSESQNPFRYSEVNRPESDVYASTRSYAVAVPDGGIRCVVPADPAGQLASAFVVTRRFTYVVSGTQARLLAERGGLSPYDAAVADGVLYLRDAGGEAVAIAAGSVRSLSRRIVEDDFDDSGSEPMRGSVGTDGSRVFWALRNGSAIGERIMVYDAQLQQWESRDVLPTDDGIRFWQPFNRTGARQLAGWRKNGTLVIYGTGTTDDGDAISFLLETADVYGIPRLAARRMAIDADSAAGSLTITTSRIPVSESGSSQTGAINVATSGRTKATENASPPPGLAGRVMRLRINGAMPAGWRLYKWQCDLNQRPEGWPSQ